MKLKLKAIRVNLGWSQKEAADKLGVSLSRYTRLEKGASRLLADEFVTIHETWGIPWDQIEP